MKADKATGGPGLTSGGVPTEPKISAHRLKLRKTYLTCLNYLEACLKLLRILTWLFPRHSSATDRFTVFLSARDGLTVSDSRCLCRGETPLHRPKTSSSSSRSSAVFSVCLKSKRELGLHRFHPFRSVFAQGCFNCALLKGLNGMTTIHPTTIAVGSRLFLNIPEIQKWTNEGAAEELVARISHRNGRGQRRNNVISFFQ